MTLLSLPTSQVRHICSSRAYGINTNARNARDGVPYSRGIADRQQLIPHIGGGQKQGLKSAANLVGWLSRVDCMHLAHRHVAPARHSLFENLKAISR